MLPWLSNELNVAQIYDQSEVLSRQDKSPNESGMPPGPTAVSLRRYISGSSSSTEAASKYESARSSSGDTPPAAKVSVLSERRRSGTLRDSSSEVAEGSEAFARTNRNSVISLSRSPSGLHGYSKDRLDTRHSSGGVVRTLRDLNNSQELEEGEILDETEPNGIDEVSRSLRLQHVDHTFQLEFPMSKGQGKDVAAMSRRSSRSGESARLELRQSATRTSQEHDAFSPTDRRACASHDFVSGDAASPAHHSERRGSGTSFVDSSAKDSPRSIQLSMHERSRPQGHAAVPGGAKSDSNRSTHEAGASILPRRSHTSLSVYSDALSSRSRDQATPARSEREHVRAGSHATQSFRRPRYSHSPDRHGLRESSSNRHHQNSDRLQSTLRSGGFQASWKAGSERSPVPSDGGNSRGSARTRSRTLSLRDNRSQEQAKPMSRTDGKLDCELSEYAPENVFRSLCTGPSK